MDQIDISKMKVADLKKELKLRGLSTNGTKNELVERLQEANAAEDPDGGALDDDLLDEDAVLADESEEGILGETSDGAVHDDDAALLTPTVTSAPAPVSKDQPVTTKKVVLNRKTAVVVPSQTPSSEEPSQVEKNSTDSDNSNNQGTEGKKKIVKLSQLTVQERAKLHSEKFGVPLSDAAKKLARAERFGLSAAANSNKKDSKPGEVDEKILKRQARFGVVAANETDIKKQKRAEKFGTATSTATNATMEEQKRKRAERFGLAV